MRIRLQSGSTMRCKETAVGCLRVAALLVAAVVLPCCSGDVGHGGVFSTATIRVAETVTGVEANADSGSASFSDDGMIIAFGSQANNLTANDGNGFGDILVKDRRTGVVENITNINFTGFNTLR